MLWILGERYDFILDANQPVGNYWLRAWSSACAPAVAIIRYEGAPEEDPEGDWDQQKIGTVRPCINSYHVHEFVFNHLDTFNGKCYFKKYTNIIK